MPGLVNVPFECPTGWTCYAPGEEPTCPDCPPPPAWECPDGWTCEPPPEPEPTVEFVVSVENGKVIGELVADSAGIADTRMVGFYLDDTLIRNESLPAFCLGGGDASPCAAWTPPRTGDLTLTARQYLRSGGSEDFVKVVTVNPNVPPEPPDSTPTEPPDTVPPAPGDSIIGQVPLGTPQNIRLVQDTTDKWLFDWDAIPEDTVTTCVGCGTWYERTAVINDPDIIGDEIYYTVGAWKGTTPYSVTNWQFDGETLAPDSRYIANKYLPLPDTLTVCVGAEAWDARGYEGPGGFVRYKNGHIIPRSEVNCVTLTPGG